MVSSPQVHPDIDSPYSLDPSDIERFRRDGYVKLKNALSSQAIDHYGPEITAKVKEMNRESRPMEQRDTYSRAFLQVINLWQHSDLVREFVFGKRLAGIAAQLLGTKSVRMYHDQALYKEPGGGFTPWHVDQQYWPLSSEKSVTAWIPLQPIPHEMGPLEFSVGSQRIKFGRDLSISDESEKEIDRHLKMSDLPIDSTPYALGEVSFHYGFTFHRAGPNSTSEPRKVMTIIYIDGEMRLAEPKNKNQEKDREVWCPGVEVGEIIQSPLNPVLYP